MINYETPLLFITLSPGLEMCCILHREKKKKQQKQIHRGLKFTAHESAFMIHFLPPFCELRWAFVSPLHPSVRRKEGEMKRPGEEEEGERERRRRRRVKEQRPGFHTHTLVKRLFICGESRLSPASLPAVETS